MNFPSHTLFKAAIIIIAFVSPLTSNAQSSFSQQVLASNPVTLSPGVSNTIINQYNGNTVNELITSRSKNLKERTKLLIYLKELNVPDDVNKYNSHRKFYYHMAGVFAHLRLYPLAMKCFLKAEVNNNRGLAVADTAAHNPEYLAISSQDDSVVNKQVVPNLKRITEIKSKKTDNTHIQEIFNDGKPAIAYAMLFHVKQPVPGKRKIFLWANTGHTFITLIKYNADSTYVSASFGFYPVKDRLLSATPLAPNTSSTFKDDAGHKWDEVLGKFISKRRFEKILALTSAYTQLNYDLNNNNCTDFGIQAASIAGIKVTETSGKWPMGSGNNPGVTGQSILQGKFENTDTLDLNGLFVDKEYFN